MPYPYPNIEDINPNVRNVLPIDAQEIYMGAFNGAWNQYEEMEYSKRLVTSHRVAWSAVKKVYEKNKEGKWVKK
jgi:cation transport regulator